MQVLADAHGHVLHLFERDCSTQRRHQKVIEEAPAPTIDEDLRHRLTTAAVRLAREVGYVNAGTVEFLLDTDTREFYFLEMNTRLQVEHPVTELICGGLDLVEHQLRIAAGEPLALTQEDLRIQGHAMEARVYAEDAFGGFLPQAGTTSIVRWPTGPGVRVDHALESSQVVSTSYDPMLGKVIVHGPDRESARHALVAALDDTAILGLTTNAGFLRSLAASDAFRDATIDTAWLDAVDLEAEVPRPDADLPRLFVAWTSAMITALDAGHPFQADGFRLGGPAAPTLVELDRDVVVDRAAGTVDGVPVHQVSAENHVLDLVVDGHRVGAVVNVQRDVAEVAWRGHRHVFTRPDRLDGAAAVTDGTVTAPMPGSVLDVRVQVGGTVAEGDVLGTLEAMKMELALKAPFAGTVVEVDVGGRRAGAARGHPLRGGGGVMSVTIYEVGPRDGLQNEAALVPTEVKAEFVRRLLAAGLPVVEATSFVHPRWVPQLADAAELMIALGDQGRDLPVLVPNERGLDRALTLGLRHVAIFGSATETFARKNLNRSLEEQFAMFRPTVARAREAGLDVRAYVSMCFGDPWEGAVPIEQVVSVGTRLLDLGASQLSIGDTIGVGTAQHVKDLIAAFGAAGVGTDRLAMHFHDTYGQALANAYAALQEGITTFDASAGGLGGCPYAESATGNLATEDLVWMLTGLGIEHGVDLDALVATSVWMARHLGRESPSAVVRALAPRAAQSGA